MTQGWVITLGQVLTSEMIDYKFSGDENKTFEIYRNTNCVSKKFRHKSLSLSLSLFCVWYSWYSIFELSTCLLV
jgi:hypothetical protein